MKLSNGIPFILVLFLSGCGAGAGHESFRFAADLEKQNRLEEAASLYEEALEKEPGNRDYRKSLNEVHQRLVSQYLTQARKQMTVQPLTFDGVKRASAEVDKALKIDPANEDGKKLAASVKAELDRLIEKADQLNTQAVKRLEAKEWKKVVDALAEIRTFYPSYPDLEDRIAAVTADGTAYQIREAERLAGEDDLEGALKAIAPALELNPTHEGAKALAARLNAENTPGRFLQRAEEAAKSGNWKRSAELFAKCRIAASDGETKARGEALQREIATHFLESASRNLGARRLYAAYSDCEAASKFIPEDMAGNADEVVEEVVEAIASKAEAYETAGRTGNALAWYEKMGKLHDPDHETSLKIQALKDRLRQRVVKKIAIMDFTPPGHNPDAGKIVTDNLLTYMTKNTSGDLKILARDILGALLKEIELGQAGLYDIESAKKAGKLKGTDIFIFGSVLQYAVDKNVDEGQRMVSAVVGRKMVPNPEYQAWAAVHPKPSEKELEAAPKSVIEEEIREIVKYKVATHKKAAHVSVSFRVVDVEEGEVVITKTLKNKKEAVDTYSEGVDFANIAFKDLKLPSDSDLLEQVVEETIAELGYAVLSRFQNLQVHHSNQAEILKKKGNLELAIERYMDAIHSEEVKNNYTLISENARREIDQLLDKVQL